MTPVEVQGRSDLHLMETKLAGVIIQQDFTKYSWKTKRLNNLNINV